MSEPEELIIEGAHFATRVARELWRRHGPLPASPRVTLARLRTRLEAFATALAGVPIAIAPLQPPAPPTWLSVLAQGSRRNDGAPLCGTDGLRVFLVPSLKVSEDEEATVAIYRLLALEQAVRLTRGTPQVAASIERGDVRDRFLFAEAIAADRWIAEHAPGLLEVLVRARREALASRVKAPPLEPAAALLEQDVRAWLAQDPRIAFATAVDCASAEASRAWAAVAAARDTRRTRHARLAPAPYWGVLLEPAVIRATAWPAHRDNDRPATPRRQQVAEMRRRPRVRRAAEDEDDHTAGAWVIRADEPQESVEDPFGLQRPADRADEADPESLADSLSDLSEARVVRTPGRAREVLASGETLTRLASDLQPSVATPAAVAYPEWDCRSAQYRLPGAIVRERSPRLGDQEWVASTLARHARFVRRVRTRFERLRPRPVRLLRQVDGAEIDLQAYVTAAADRRAGVTPDDRVYVAVRPGRRDLAVALLLDVSASTDAWVSTNRRIVDVEKEAMLLVCEALDALGDRYGLFAFSGESAEEVAVLPLKGFHERSSMAVRRRIAALDSDRYTRLGAPIRHVTAALSREAAASRLLLLLSDGKPNDVDLYEGAYGVEDTRQAVAEARRQGVSVFCVTVDREAPAYASRIFGPTGFAVLRKPEQLPAVVVEILRHLIRA